MMFDDGDYYSPSSAEMFTCLSSGSSSKKSKMMNKRRFTDEQVKSLECIFENETKLEPKKKLQLARELGLQPRQVAIWFQNKRARYKSKELEKEYNVLRASYNSLASQFDNLKKEKQSLLIQVEKLKDLVEKANRNDDFGATNSEGSRSEIDDKSDSNNTNKSDNQSELKPTLSLEGSEYGASILSDEGSSHENTNYFGMEQETDILTLVQPVVGGSLASIQGWDDDLHPDGLFDQPVDSSQWLDFWS